MARAKLFKDGHRTLNVKPELYELVAEEAKNSTPRLFPAQVLEIILTKHYTKELNAQKDKL